MRLLSPRINLELAPAGALLVLLLTACAAPNPLMQEPATASAKEAKPAAAATAATPAAVPTPVAQAPAANPAVAPAAAAPAPQAAAPAAPAPIAVAPVAQPAASGVQTTQSRGFLGFFSPYRPDVQQGNFVSQEMMAQLKTGMTPDQVRFVLGTPLLVDIFHVNRWDYVFRMQKGNGEVTTSRVAVFYKDGRVARVEGGDLPTEEDYLARLSDAPRKAPAAGTAPAVSSEAAKAAAPSAAAPK
jgi:outer membrane protein assembly factor BamE